MKTGRAWFCAAGLCLALAAVFAFLATGYRTTALCFCGLAAVLAFYGLMARKGDRTARVLSLLMAACLLAGLVLFLVQEIPILRDARSDEDTDAPYLIVMGAAVHGSTPSLSMIERTEAALAWLREHPGGIAVLSGGQGSGEDMTEAQAMADYLTARGIPSERLIREPEATSSYENILFSLRLIEARGGDVTGRIALCSSEYHMHRMDLIARELGFQPVNVAARTSLVSLRVNYLIRESFAMWKCTLFGVA